MPLYVVIIDIFGFLMAVTGFNMAFRQSAVRAYFNKSQSAHERSMAEGENSDPLTYILRIAGIMIMVFGMAIAGMFTLINLQ